MPKPVLPVGTSIRVTVHATPLDWQGCAYPLVPGVCGTIEALPPNRWFRRAIDVTRSHSEPCTEDLYYVKFERHELDEHDGPLDTSMWCILCAHEIEPVD
jgi:hypothetical protein